MKFLVNHLIVGLSVFLFLSNVKAVGIEVGNGGSSVVCRDRNKKIASVELFDLYEGRTLRGRTYKESPVPYQKQARNYINLIAAALGHDPDTEGGMQQNLEQNFKNLQFLPSGTGLTPIGDINSIVLPKSCELAQTANFVDSALDRTTIYIDSDIWNEMSETQKAALLVHETVYQYLRDTGPKRNFVEVDSSRTRTVVSQLFSGIKPESLDTLVDLDRNSTPLYCRTVDAIEADRRASYFFIYKNTSGTVTLQFIGLADRQLLTRTTLPGKVWSNGTLEASGNVISNFTDSLNVYVTYSKSPNSQNTIRVTDANGYSQRENFVCEPAEPGRYQ